MPSQLLLRAACRRVTTSSVLKKVAMAAGGSSSSSSSPRMSYFSTKPAKKQEKPTLVHEKESFLSGTSSVYAETMYELYLQDPKSVHKSWRQYFDNLQSGVAYSESDYDKPTGAKPTSKVAIAALSGVRLLDICVACVCVCVPFFV